MSEPSTEAVVAGEAASAAVEEVQNRQELADSVLSAEAGAAAAEEIASTAVETASLAADVAINTSQELDNVAAQTSTAIDLANEARAENAETSDYAREAYNIGVSNRDAMAELKTTLDNFLAASATSPETDAVREVPVDDHTKPDAEGTGNAEESSDHTDTRRYGRRVRRNRRAGTDAT